MYASLGNIIFEKIISFDQLSDSRTTNYAQLPLINGKPALQRTGEALVEVQMGIHYNIAFCYPEEEYLKLNTARLNAEVMPFIYGNGYNEGDFVITKLDRTINQTDPLGNFIDITVSITLLEYAGADASAKQLEQDRKNAFAISANRPLPSNPQMQMDNPALSVCIQNTNIQQATVSMDSATNAVNKNVDFINTSVIDKAQKFVDQIPSYTRKINDQVTKTSNAIGSVNSLILTYSSITGTSPTLPTKLGNVQTALLAINTQLLVLGTLPNPITNSPDAISAINELTATLAKIKTLKDNTDLLNSAQAPIAVALATKKIMT